MLVIVFTNSTGYTCHGCLGKTSLMEYEKIGKFWQLKKKVLAFADGYEWGLSQEVEVLNLGPPRQYGLLVTTGFTSMGIPKRRNICIRLFRENCGKYLCIEVITQIPKAANHMANRISMKRK